jgi:hypothetical protein
MIDTTRSACTTPMKIACPGGKKGLDNNWVIVGQECNPLLMFQRRDNEKERGDTTTTGSI